MDFSVPIRLIPMMIQESAPIFASVISSISRAGLNVVDRRHFRNVFICPIVIGYWNNLLPVLLIFPMVIASPAIIHVGDDLLSLEVMTLSLLIQLVAYSFSHAFKFLRVADIAILSKTADITIPLILSLIGVYSIKYDLLWMLPAIVVIFFLSAGATAAKKSALASMILILMLSIQGIYSYFIGSNSPLDRGSWALISFTFAVLIWRFLFSAGLLLLKKGIFSIFAFPRNHLSLGGFYLRGFLTAITQLSFIFAISSKELMLVWPILNTTGFMGAIFAYLFLGERLNIKDFMFIFISIVITGIAFFGLNYERF